MLRLQLFFDTPNQLGTAAAMLASAVFVFFATPQERSPRDPVRLREVVLHLLSFCALAFLAYLIARTGSRGSYVAFSAAAALSIHLRKPNIIRITQLLVIVAIPLVAAASLRGRLPINTDHLIGDRSIVNRLVLWRNSLTMAWDHFPFGVGMSNFREYYTAWYQPVSDYQLYQTAVSDFVSIAAFFGIPMAAAYSGVLILITYINLTSPTVDTDRSDRVHYLVLPLVAYAISSSFSTLFMSRILLVVGVGLIVCVSFVSVGRIMRRDVNLRPLALLSFANLTLWLAGPYILAKTSTSPRLVSSSEPYRTENGELFTAHLLKPRKQRSDRVVIILSSRYYASSESRLIARPLLASGFPLLILELPHAGDAIAAIRSSLFTFSNLSRHEIHPLSIIALPGTSRAAFFGAEYLEKTTSIGIVFMDGNYWHPDPALSIDEHLNEWDTPVLFFAEVGNATVDRTEMRGKWQTMVTLGLPVTMIEFGPIASIEDYSEIVRRDLIPWLCSQYRPSNN